MDYTEKLKSRKLQVTLIVFVSATTFLTVGILPPELWVELVKWTAGIYALGNVGEHAAKTVAKK
ncbi:hypothetical protein [Salinibacter grassmerensis]|uniref:hypothetical protein n=1 Tax=Salinibacter grassmerensis TaxID=3040353 RepID=UPI0021E8DD3D|nr:hypothetical protein [Salinibacter grassmerensis]